MVRVIFPVAAFWLVMGTVAHARSPIPITGCENITRPGDYIVANDLVLDVSNPSYGGGGDCLIVSSSHVNIEMQNWAITAACVPFECAPEEYGPIGGAGVYIESEADHVAISNLNVQNFVYGIVVNADYTYVSGATLNAVVGITLNNVSHSGFSNVSYTPGDERYNAANGPMLSVSGGGHNLFRTLSDSASQVGLRLTNSSHNAINGANVNCEAVAEAGPGILLTEDSNYNYVANSNVFVLYGNGVEVDAGSDHNVIEGDTALITSPPGYFAMLDENPNCGHNIWTNDSFTNANPESCIK